MSLATAGSVVERLRAAVESTGATGFGAFAGLTPLDAQRLLAASTDGVGTKLVLARALEWNLRVQEHGGRRTFVATNAGYRLEVHPPREWIDELLDDSENWSLGELQLRADEPETKAGALADILGLEAKDNAVQVGGTLVHFLAGGPEGRPELYAERFA